MPKRGSSTVIGGGKRRRARPQEFPKEKAETEDRLSELPDCLLLLILSFLPTKEVVKTCLLSKRWRFLWTYMSEVNLVEDNWNDADTRRFVDCVGRMLVMHRGIYLKKFAVSFYYDEIFASNVDTWVQFAIKNKVKDITLRCLLENLYFFASNSFEFLYKLPQMLYSNSSLTGLTIYSCDVAPQTVVAWGSLKSLSIGGVTLQDNIMENILSGCPVLEVLCLTEFRGLNCLNICSQNLKKLVIERWNGSLLEISAPYVLDLSISVDISDEAGYFRLKNISSVVRAKLYFEHSGFVEDYDDPHSSMNYMKELLESIKNAEELELGPWCIEVLSVMEAKGCKLPQSTRSCLTLNPWSVKEAVPGILGILKSSPDLTTLVVEGRYVHAYVPLDGVAKYLHNNDFDLDAFHLKSVKINNFIDDDLPGEPMLTMARILLKSSRVLEKMVISTKKLIDFSSYEGSCNLAEIAIKLLTFPRASPEAVVMVDN